MFAAGRNDQKFTDGLFNLFFSSYFGLGPLIFKFFVSFFPNRPGIMHEKKKKKHYHNSPIDFDQTFKILKLYDFLLTPDLIPSR